MRPFHVKHAGPARVRRPFFVPLRPAGGGLRCRGELSFNVPGRAGWLGLFFALHLAAMFSPGGARMGRLAKIRRDRQQI